MNEYLRTYPGAFRSSHPEAPFAAVGQLAQRFTENQPLNYGYGSGSPLSKLGDAGGKVLILGVPLDTITLLHYAEFLAGVPNKRGVKYSMPVLRNEERVWIDFEEYDTSRGIIEWQGEDCFSISGKEYISAGRGPSGLAGNANSCMFDAKDLVEFAVQWMERTF